MSEVLKVNTTLTELNLEGGQQQKYCCKQGYSISAGGKSGNMLYAEGVIELSEVLKTNTTLKTLILTSVRQQQEHATIQKQHKKQK